MTTTTYPNFNDQTEALEVASAFPDAIRQKTILITGVNIKGIGYATAEAFASQSPACLIIAGRSPDKIHESIVALQQKSPNVKYIGLKLDLSSQKAVRVAAIEVLEMSEVPSIDIIVNSAGIMNLPERQLSEDGIEMQFATNHVGHYLFTCLIMPKLLKAGKNNRRGATRIINVTSLSPTWSSMRWSDMNFDKVNKDLPEAEQPSYDVHRAWGVKDPELASYLPLEGYNQSKVANALFSIAINSRLYEKHGILSVAVHPGVIMTELGRNTAPETMEAIQQMIKEGRFSLRSPGAGASTTLVAALDPKLGPGEAKNGKQNLGVYMMDCQISDKATSLAESTDEADKLWELSQRLVGERFE